MTNCLDLDHDREQAQYAREAHLRACGWKHSSTHPGSYWLWSRELVPGHTREGPLPAREYHLPFDLAWSIQRQLEDAARLDTCEHENEP